MLRTSVLGAPGTEYLGFAVAVVYAATVLLLAIGLSRESSIVARRPLGTTSLAVVAVWPLAADLATRRLAVIEPQGWGPAWTVFGYIAIVVPAAAGLIASLQIARVGAVPGPGRWAPTWVLGFHTLAWVLPQFAIAAVGPAQAQSYVELFAMLSTLAFLAGTLGLGILTLVLVARRRDASVEVFRSH